MFVVQQIEANKRKLVKSDAFITLNIHVQLEN